MKNENKNLSERLRFTLNLLGISQTELANKINVKPQIIQYLCQGKAEKSKFTFEIAEALNVDVSWLAAGIGAAPSKFSSDKKDRAVPLLTFNQIKEREINNRKMDIKKVASWVSVNENISLNSFALILNDKSMAPRFDIDTIVIIDPTINVYETQQNNRFVLAYLADEDFFVFRQLNVTNNIKSLIPHNTNLYKDVLLTEKDIIFGICKEARWSN